jgi:uncharacterized protein YceH (UPF0502 family)
MSSQPAAVLPEVPVAWPVLSVGERRVLGVLVEKAKTTPDVYPLSLNSLATGCNQKSNRDPLLNLSDLEVEEALSSVQKKGLIIKITGGRVERWRHILYETWRVEKIELAVLAELLLRGPQTEGELRTRASRMEPIADLEALRTVLKHLAERRLIIYVTPEGRRGTVVTHGFHDAQELQRFRANHAAEANSAPADEVAVLGIPADASAQLASTPASAIETEAEITQLRAEVSDLQAKVASMAEELRTLKEALGV